MMQACALTGLISQADLNRGALTEIVAGAIEGAGYTPRVGTLHVCLASDETMDPMSWAATFIQQYE